MKQLKLSAKFLLIALFMFFQCACGLDVLISQGTAAKQKQEEQKKAAAQVEKFKEKLKEAQEQRDKKLREYQ